jgi:murein DD-endopeptidase MepM/ murein hydrolase activator NlpD
MSKFAKGIKKGARVSMGQTIGYVGSTGLASGPHLCYRFWKNGKQVDALREKLPAAHGIDQEDADNFKQVSQQMITQLDHVEESQPVVASYKREYKAGL